MAVIDRPDVRLRVWAAAPVAAVICIGFGLQCYWWLTYPAVDSPDAIIYLNEAHNLFSSGLMQTEKYMPLYPALIHLAGADGIIALQIALSTVSIYLGYRISFDVWRSNKAAFAAALLLTVHPMLIYYTTFRLTETVFIFLVLLGIAFIYRNQVLAASIAFTLANLTRPSLDLIFPAIVIAGTLATTTPTIREINRRLAVFGLVYCALMSPWWVHNFVKYHQFVRLDLGGGITMVLENNTVFDRDERDWTKLDWAGIFAPFDKIADPVKRDMAMRSAGLAYIAEDPIRWLRADIDRAKHFFTPSDLFYSKFQKKVSAVLFAIMIAGALTSLAFTASWRHYLPLWIPILFLTALHISFHAPPRYRLPLDPLFIILASGVFAAPFLKRAKPLKGDGFLPQIS